MTAAGRRNQSPGDGPPPPGAPWDSPLREAPLAFLDLEMTGLDLRKDRVIEICIERVRGETLEGRLESLVDPAMHGNASIHGISADELVGAPAFGDLAPRVAELLDGAVVVAHAAEWDLNFLSAELARCGAEAPKPHALDSLVLARRAFHEASYALSSLAASLGIEVRSAHRAGDDVRTLRAVFSGIVSELAPSTPRDLWMVRIGHTSEPRPEVVEACQQAAQSGAPVRITYRPASSGPQELDMIVTVVDGPHAHGFLLPSRGRRTLLLARVLKVALPEKKA